jgi:hypothetical protein
MLQRGKQSRTVGCRDFSSTPAYSPYAPAESKYVVDLKLALKSAPSNLRGRAKDLMCYTIVYAVALYGSIPLFSASSVPHGFDSVMHFSKIRIFSQFFPSIPRWFPWWYCGTPTLRFYPPLSYYVPSSISWLLKTSPLEAYQFTEFFSFYLAGLFMYHFMKALTNSRFTGVSSAILYMLSPQTLYGRFFGGHFTHNFSIFLIPLTLFCIVKYGDNIKRTALITTPLFSLLFLSHLQTTLSFGFMLGIYIFFSLTVRLWKKELEWTSIEWINTLGLFLGGVLGAFLAGFWLFPFLLEGLGTLSVTSEAALKAMYPIESLFVEAENPWLKNKFLGFPLILLFLLAIGLIVKRKLDAKRTFWGIIFASWIAFFLFAIVSPYIGLVFGWPGRLAQFVCMPMAMLAGLAVNWIEDRVLSFFGKSGNLKRLVLYCLLTVMILSVLVHTSNVEKFAMKSAYANAMEVSKWIDSQNLKPSERVASFGTFSYVFNVLSDSWQLDGGYVLGQINVDFYYKYWITLTTVDNLDVILKTLNETNSRYIVFYQGSAIPSAYQNQTFFERNDMYRLTIFKLRDNYTLNFVEVTEGNASVNYSYLNPDELHLRVQDCSEDVTLVIRMNYYPGWAIHSTRGEVMLTKDSNGLMKIEIHGADSSDITLQCGSTLIDHIGLGATIVGAAAYLFLLLRRFFRR